MKPTRASDRADRSDTRRRRHYAELTPAEATTWELAQRGLPRPEIARRLGVQLTTVHARMATAKHKLACAAAAEAEEPA